MLRWSEEFETGHSLIDTQHKMLISYINRLGGLSCTTNPSRQEVEFILQLVSFMENYVDAHFRQEEDCMASYRCPVHQVNKEAHRKFLLFFRDFKRQCETHGFRPDTLVKLHEYCRAWIQDHILKIDKQLTPCLSRSSNPDSPA